MSDQELFCERHGNGYVEIRNGEMFCKVCSICAVFGVETVSTLDAQEPTALDSLHESISDLQRQIDALKQWTRYPQ